MDVDSRRHAKTIYVESGYAHDSRNHKRTCQLIEFLQVVNADGSYTVKCARVSPSVYLDTCALRTLSQPAVRDRFVKAIKASGGTLVLSWLPILELSGQDPKYAQAIGAMVDMVAPQLYFLDDSPDRVFENEHLVRQSQLKYAPDSETKIFQILAKQVYLGNMSWGVSYHTNGLIAKMFSTYPTIKAHGLKVLDQLERPLVGVSESEKEPPAASVRDQSAHVRTSQKLSW